MKRTREPRTSINSATTDLLEAAEGRGNIPNVTAEALGLTQGQRRTRRPPRHFDQGPLPSSLSLCPSFAFINLTYIFFQATSSYSIARGEMAQTIPRWLLEGSDSSLLAPPLLFFLLRIYAI